jgi:hypothetical protein
MVRSLAVLRLLLVSRRLRCTRLRGSNILILVIITTVMGSKATSKFEAKLFEANGTWSASRVHELANFPRTRNLVIPR